MNTNHNQNDSNDPEYIAPDNYLIWAILATLFCCLPLGVLAILKATKVNNLWLQGKHHEARIASDEALNYIKFSGLIAFFIWILYFILNSLFDF